MSNFLIILTKSTDNQKQDKMPSTAIDNMDQLRKLLVFYDEKSMYHVMILQRRKDNPGLSVNSKHVRSYYIHSLEEFDKSRDSIVTECASKNARAYLNMNVKDIEKIALLVMQKTAELIYNKQYEAVSKVYEHCCGNAPFIHDKVWMVDVDTTDSAKIERVELQLANLGAPIIDTVMTANGRHILTRPFPLNKFDAIEDVLVMKQATTLMYKPPVSSL